MRGEERDTNALHLATMDSCTLEKFDLLLNTPYEKIDVNCKNNEGETPLLLACKMGNKKKAIMLARHRADPKIAGDDGVTPLSMGVVQFTLLNDGLDMVFIIILYLLHLLRC